MAQKSCLTEGFCFTQTHSQLWDPFDFRNELFVAMEKLLKQMSISVNKDSVFNHKLSTSRELREVGSKYYFQTQVEGEKNETTQNKG